MSDQKTFGDALFAMARAAGIGPTNDKLKALLEDEFSKTPVGPEDFFDKFNSRYMTFQQALENPGVRQKLEGELKAKFSGQVHGALSEISEKAALNLVKELGEDPASWKELFETTKDHKERWPEMFRRMVAIGKKQGANEANPDETLKTEMARIKSEMAALKNSSAADIGEWKSKAEAYQKQVEAEQNAFREFKTDLAIKGIVRNSVKFGDHIPADGLDLIIQGKINNLKNQYHITNNNGEFKLFQLDDPTQVATDPATGHALNFQKVLTAQFGEEYLAKKPPQTPSRKPGTPPAPSPPPNGQGAHVSTWKDRMLSNLGG